MEAAPTRPIGAIFSTLPNLKKFDTLDERILVQKSFYFMQRMGVIKNKFTFSLYIYGPYSSDLAKVSFDHFERGKESEIEISPDFEEKVKTFEMFLSEVLFEGVADLELAATIDFLRKEGKSEKEIMEFIKKTKGHLLRNDNFTRIWNLLDKYGLNN